jgi:histidine ammonia-lyase
MQEDHVSMGWASARKLRTAVRNLARIVAIEATVAARGLELRAPLSPGPGTLAALEAIRASVPGFGPDRIVAPELAAVEELVAGGSLVGAVERAIGALA